MTLIDEYQARAILKNEQGSFEYSCGKISDNIKKMNYYEEQRALSVHFNNIQIKKLNRSYFNFNDINQKYFLIFKTVIEIDEEHKYTVITVSLPFTIIFNATQELKAWAAVTWYNSFSDFVS